MELITTHTHTSFVTHAKDSVQDMVAAGAAAGITTYAVTEHYPCSDKLDPTRFISMRWEDLDNYKASILALRAQYPAMEILLGTELDWFGDQEDRDLSNDDFADFDIVLGSVHFVDGWAFDDPEQAGYWQEVGPDAIWRRYFEIWCDACVSDRPFDVMSHPDLVKKFGYFSSFDPMPLYKQAAEAAQAGGRMIELNTSGNYYACKQQYPAPELLREFCRAGIPATIGTDAHEVAHVARDIDKAYKFLYEAGYRQVTVPTIGGGRRSITIE